MPVRPLRQGEEVIEAMPAPRGPRVRPLREGERVLADRTQEQPGFFRRAFETVTEAVTGRERGRGERPEFGSLADVGTEGARARIGLGLATTPDEEARAQIIQRNIPGTEFRKDDSDNTIVVLPDGREAFLNAPGLSFQDFVDLGADVVKFLPTARFALGGKTMLTRAARGGIGGAATALGEDIAALPQGSRQAPDPVRIGVTAAAGAVSEPISSALTAAGRKVGGLLRRAFGQRLDEAFDESGQLTRRARIILERGGIDPDDVSPELAQRAVRLSEQGVPPESVAGAARGERFDLPLTRGQITREEPQLGVEEQFRGQGGQAGATLRGFDRRQNERLTEITRELEEELGQRAALATEAEGGAIVAGEVRQSADALLLDIDDAFKTADQANATLSREGLDRLGNAASVVQEQGIRLNPRLTPATIDALEELGELTGKDVNERTIEKIETTRRVLGNLQDATQNRADLRGVTLIKRRFDEFLEDAFENALFSGDEQALGLLKNARRLRAEYGRRFQENRRRTRSGRQVADPGGRVIETIIERNPTDEEVGNLVFGRARLFNNRDAINVVQRLRDAAGDTETVDRTLKQMAFRRIARQAITDGQFSPRRFSSAFERVMDNHAGVMRSIFNDDEIRAIREFRDLANQTRTPERLTDRSGTAAALTRVLGSLGMVFGLQRGGIGFGALGGRLGRGVGRMVERSADIAEVDDIIDPQFVLTGRPNQTTIASTIAAIRQGEPGVTAATRVTGETRSRELPPPARLQ